MKEVDEAQVKEVKEEVKEEEKVVLVPDDKFLEIVEPVEEIQKEWKFYMAKKIHKDFNTNGPLSTSLRQYRDDLKKYVDESKDPDATKLYDQVDAFIMHCSKIADMGVADEPYQVNEDYEGNKLLSVEAVNNFFSGENGLRETVLAIKRYKSGKDYPMDLVEKSETIIHNIEEEKMNVMIDSPKKYSKTSMYVAMNSGDLNMAEGEELLEGISKVVAVYQLAVKDGVTGVETRGFFEVMGLLNMSSEKVLKNKTFKEYFALKDKSKKVDTKKVQETVKKNNEWEAAATIRYVSIQNNRKKKEEEKKRAEEERKKAEEEAKLKEEAKELGNKEANPIPENKSLIDEFEVIESPYESQNEDDFFVGYEPAKPKYDTDVERGISLNEGIARRRAYENRVRDSYDDNKDVELNDLERAIASGVTVVAIFDQISSELKEFKRAFLNAQVDKNANSSSDAPQEGPEDYRAILKIMDRIIDNVDNKRTETSIGEVGTDLAQMYRLVKQYKAEHKPRVRGHRTKESAKRYDIMNIIADTESSFKKITNEAFNQANADYIELTGHYVKSQNKMMLDHLTKNKRFKDLKLTDVAGLAVAYNLKESQKCFDKGQSQGLNKLIEDERAYHIDRILKHIKKQNPLYDVYGFYDGIEEREYGNSITSGDKTSIIDEKYANLADLARAGIIMREIRKLKTREVTIEELRELDHKITRQDGINNDFTQLIESNGFKIDMETAYITKVNNKLETAERLATGLERNMKGMAGINSDFLNMSSKDLNEAYLQYYKSINYNLAYNIGTAAVMGKPENSKILHQMMALDNYYNDDNMKDASYRRIKRDVFDYINKSGIIEDMRKEGKHKLENAPELAERLNDPKFLKGLTKVLDKATQRELDNCKSTIMKNAKDFYQFSKNPDAYFKKKLESSDKQWNKIYKIQAKNEKIEKKQEQKRKENLETIGNLIDGWAVLQPVPDELLKFCPFRNPAFAYGLRDRYISNARNTKYLADDNYRILPIKQVDLEKIRKGLHPSVALPKRKKDLQALGEALDSWKMDMPEPPFGVTKCCPNGDKAYAEVLRDRYLANGKDVNKLVNADGFLLPVTPKELEDAQKVIDQRTKEAEAKKAEDAKKKAGEANNKAEEKKVIKK